MSHTVAEQLALDAELLERCERGGPAAFRTWSSPVTAVVVGRSQEPEREVEIERCESRDIAIHRRTSGGGAVVIGPGTLQYTFALPYGLSEELASIEGSKRFCNRLLLEGLERDDLGEDRCGDLLLGDRKVGGLALRRRRHALLLHGTLLTEMSPSVIEELLRHPSREPAYRAGRAHGDFLAGIGPVDSAALGRRVLARLETIGGKHGPVHSPTSAKPA